MFANKVKKVAAIHDLSGMGRVSLTVVIPILSSMGFQVCPLPTAILSNHTQYPDFTFLDLTDEMPRIIAEWKRLEVEFDAIYTGYLGSPRQIQIVSDFIRDFRRKDSLTVIDPVLGDNGKLYSNFNESMVVEMQHLVTHADVITPNLTELFYLLDRPYKESNTDQELKEYLRCLSDKGPEVVIITSVPVLDEPHKTSVYAYNRTGNRYWKITCPYLPAHYPGTGDTFTSGTSQSRYAHPKQQLRVDLSSDSEFCSGSRLLIFIVPIIRCRTGGGQSIDDKRQINCNGKSTFLHKWEKHCSPDWKQCFSPFKRALLFYFFPFFVQYHSHVCSVFLSNDYFVKFTFFFSCYRCFLDG